MSWLGFRALNSTVEWKFTTAVNGVPATLGGSPVVSIYENANATEFTTGVTLAVDYDGRTGFNRLLMDTSSGYTAGKSYAAVITTGTINSQSVAGTVVCEFAIGGASSGEVEASNLVTVAGTSQTARDLGAQLDATVSSRLAPTVAGRTLDVSTGGEAGLDWANVGSPASANNLSSTTIQAVNNLASGTDSINTTATSGSTLTTGSTTSGTYASTANLDGTNWQIADAAGTLDMYFEFNVGAVGVPTTAVWTGALTGTADTLKVYAYNWGGAVWDQVGTLNGTLLVTTQNEQFDFTTAHVGTGGNLGLVRLRFQNTGLTTAAFYTDQVLCGYTNVQVFPSNFSLLAITGAGAVTPDAAAVRSAVGLASANLDTQLSGIQNDLPQRITKNVALSNFPFKMVLSSDHVTPATGLTVTAQRRIDNGAFANCTNSGAITEVASGWYSIDLSASDLNGNTIALKFTAATADQLDVTVVTEPT